MALSHKTQHPSIEHLFLALLEQPRSDFAVIARKCGISVAGLEADLQAEIGRFKAGNSRTPVFSPHLPKLFEHAWLIASLDTESGQPNTIRSGHLLLALLTEPDLVQLAYRGSKLFVKFKIEMRLHVGRLFHAIDLMLMHDDQFMCAG